MNGNSALLFALLCGLVAVVYGFWARASILSLDTGNQRMHDIAAAIKAQPPTSPVNTERLP